MHLFYAACWKQCFALLSSPPLRLKSVSLRPPSSSRFYDDSRRLVSFAKQAQDPSKRSTESENVKESMLVAIEVIMNTMLDDSNDAVRILALESLMYVLHFVRPHYDQPLDQATPKLPTPTPTSSLPSFVPTSTSFEGMTEALLLRSVNGSPTEEFLNQLDFVLRSLAIFNLSKFEQLVRSKLSLLVGIHSPPSQASDLFSGLLDHAEMLLQFASI